MKFVWDIVWRVTSIIWLIISTLFNPLKFFERGKLPSFAGKSDGAIVRGPVGMVLSLATNLGKALILVAMGFMFWHFPDELMAVLGMVLPDQLQPLLGSLNAPSRRGVVLVLYFLGIVPSVLICLSSEPWAEKFLGIIGVWFWALLGLAVFLAFFGTTMA